MVLKMNRGKGQIMLQCLPNQTFEFQRVGTISRVTGIRAVPIMGLNPSQILAKVSSDAKAWRPDCRPALRDDVLDDPTRFILLDPIEVRAEMFPKVLWCAQSCNRVYDFGQRNTTPLRVCPSCNSRLYQLRWIRIHTCGAMEPLTPPRCARCHSSQNMALDTRGGERFAQFRWICRACSTSSSVFAGPCRECGQGDMELAVHRSGRTFYARQTVVLNTPGPELASFLAIPDAPLIAAAKLFGVSELVSQPLASLSRSSMGTQGSSDSGLSGADLDSLLERQSRGEITPEQMATEMQSLRVQRLQERRATSPSGIIEALEKRTGVPRIYWDRAGHEMIEAAIPLELRTVVDLFRSDRDQEIGVARRLGLSRLLLVDEFPIVTATYGYTRGDYAPNSCNLRPFPPEAEHNSRYPVYIDQVQADALLLSLDSNRVCRWLERNGHVLNVPTGTDVLSARRAYIVQLFDGESFRSTLDAGSPTIRMVFGLLHTMSHMCIRQAAILCGLERNSLSEYLLPRTLCFAVYCNHHFGATIGALTALYQQSLNEWLSAVLETRHCVYDPVCREREGSCHACTHLAETSCRVFNLNLGRAFLFGGHDDELGVIQVGYFDPSLSDT